MHHSTTAACLLIAAALGQAACAAATPLSKGVVLYWHCDDDAEFSWRDNHWQKGGSPRVTYDTAQRVHGKASVRLEGEAGSELRMSSLTKPALVTADGRYVLRFHARTEGTKGKAMVRVLAHGPRTERRQYKPLGWVRLTPKLHYVLPSDSDWTRHEVLIEKLPGGVGRLFVYIVIAGEGTVWFDEVSIADQGVDVPLGGKIGLDDSDYAGVRFDDAKLPNDLLKNGDFEKGLRPWRIMGSGSTAKVERIDGTNALRFDAKEFTSLHVHQHVRVDPRREYRLSLRAKTADPGLIGYFFTHVLPFNKHRRPMGYVSADHSQEFNYVTGKTDGWVRREQVLSLRPNADSVNVYLRVSDTIGTVWIDDVKLTPLPLSGEGGKRW